MGNTNCLCVGKWSLRTRLTGFSLWVVLYLLISNHVTILPIQKMFICILLKEWTEEKTNKNLYMSMQSHKQNTCIGEMGYYYIKMVIIFSLFLQNFYNVVMKDIFKMFNLQRMVLQVGGKKGEENKYLSTCWEIADSSQSY